MKNFKQIKNLNSTRLNECWGCQSFSSFSFFLFSLNFFLFFRNFLYFFCIFFRDYLLFENMNNQGQRGSQICFGQGMQIQWLWMSHVALNWRQVNMGWLGLRVDSGLIKHTNPLGEKTTLFQWALFRFFLLLFFFNF